MSAIEIPNIHRTWGLVVVAAALFLGHGRALAGAVVIVNGNPGIESISKGDLKSVLLGKKKKWDNGSRVMVSTLKSGDCADGFLKDVCGKSASQFLAFWKKLVFSGKGMAPKALASPDELVAYVAATEGAIGFVPEGTDVKGAKAVSVSD